MDDMATFERKVEDEIIRIVGPVRPIDDLAIFDAITATQSPKWRLQSMFSATKLVVAGAIVALFGGFLLAGVLTTGPSDESIPAAATDEAGTFSPAGSLADERAGHTSTLLPDGRVLAIGGFDEGEVDALASAEVWDPSTDSFDSTGSLIEARHDHTATLLPDGRVLVIGGRARQDGAFWADLDPDLDQDTHPVEEVDTVASAEVWDPSTESFGPAGSLADPRQGHTATLLPDGRVLVIGGRFDVEEDDDNELASAEVWDPATASFSYLTPTLSEGRTDHTATLLPDGRVFVIGGRYNVGDDSDVRSVEIWDSATGLFSTGGSLANTRRGHTATLLPDGCVLVIGNPRVTSVARWGCDPVHDMILWDDSLAEPRSGHSATLLPDGRVLVVGGGGSRYDMMNDDITTRASAEVLDPATGGSVPAGSLAEGRQDFTATLLRDGRVIVIGGLASDGMVASAEIWERSDG